MDVTWMMDLEMAGFFRQQKKTVDGKVVYISTIYLPLFMTGVPKKHPKRCLGIGFFETKTVSPSVLFCFREHCEDNLLSESLF